LLISRNDFGDTPMHAAAVEGHLDVIPPEFLTAATLNVRNYNGGTPVGAAVRYGHVSQLPAEFAPKPPSAWQRLLYKIGFARPNLT
jgi:hypothetical protein